MTNRTYPAMPPEEFMRTAEELMADVRHQSRNATLALVKQVVRQTRMHEPTKTYLLHQIEALRLRDGE